MRYHYVYRITNKILNKHYYGIRTSNILPIDDLGIKYFSSSKDKDFIKDQKENSQNFKYKIIKVCKTRLQALELEILLHAKFDVGVNESFYNKAKQTSTGYDTFGIKLTEEQLLKRKKLKGQRKCSEETKKRISEALTGKKHSPAHIKINSETHKGIKHSEETKNKISKLWEEGILTGHKHTEEAKKKISNNSTYKTEEFRETCRQRQLGIKLSEETKKKQSETLKGKPKEKIECPHCGKIGGVPQMKQHHFDNCKNKG